MAVEKNTGRSTENCQRHPDGVVRCPFCGSLHTKFKYFNNKKIEQPRYKCSDCKRLWTQGGRIRGTYRRTEEAPSPVATDTTDTTSLTTSYTTDTSSLLSQPSVSAVSTPTPAGTEEAPSPVAAHTTDTSSQPSQPWVSAVSTPTPSASDESDMGGGSAGRGSSTCRWNALLEAAKRCQERDFPDLE